MLEAVDSTELASDERNNAGRIDLWGGENIEHIVYQN